jgi:hypothetical protein
MEIALGVVIGVAILIGVAYYAVRGSDRPMRRSPTGDNNLDLTYTNADPPGPHHDGGF